MISTLIRAGGGYSLPYTTRYREEYLVDTETNEIIYPKTRLEDIIGLEGFEPPSSIDDLIYYETPYYEPINNVKLIGQTYTTIYETTIDIPGLYFIYGSFISSNTANPRFPNAVIDNRIGLYNKTDDRYFAETGLCFYAAGSGISSISSMHIIQRPSIIQIRIRAVYSSTIGKAYTAFKYFKIK